MATTATVTLGVSLAVPEPHGSMLQRLRAGYGDAAAYGIPTHITLLPPTQVEAAARAEIEAHLARVALAGQAFRVRLSGTGTFRPVSPVVFVKVAEGGPECDELQTRLRAADGPLARELQFPYHPHVTVAHGIAEEAMDTAYSGLADFEAAWQANGFALYEQGEDQVWRFHREFTFGGVHGPGALGAEPQGTPLSGAAPIGSQKHMVSAVHGAVDGAVPCRPPAQRRPAHSSPAN